MADKITATVVFNGTKRLALLIDIVSDGSNTAYTITASTYSAGSFAINKITYSCAGMGFILDEENSGTDPRVLSINGTGGIISGKFCFEEYGGLKNSDASGNTGNLIITPLLGTSADTCTIFIELIKAS
jgi:hypothetical protein